jgi:hypothetical protein
VLELAAVPVFWTVTQYVWPEVSVGAVAVIEVEDTTVALLAEFDVPQELLAPK